jgi:DNA topoisomerase-2
MSAQKYKKFTQLEHVLARPGMYIGSTENDEIKQWVLGDQGRMVERLLTFPPGLFKIFDEILVNAIDHSTDPAHQVDKIAVEVDRETGAVTVTNTGTGIPVEMHPQHNMYVPELIFGNLMTSSNYDDTQERVVGGTNGYGSKLTNIFSTKFAVETADPENKKVYAQEWTDNMSVCGKPSIKKYTKAKGYTKISFVPDYKRFKMKSLTDDAFKLFERRTYDCTATTGDKVKVYFNGTLCSVKNFDKYAGLYLPDDAKRAHETSADGRWDVIVSVSDHSFRQVSFVNGIHTSLGGSHVDAVTGNIIRKVGEAIALKHKNLVVKPAQIKDNLFVFLRATIVNPAFSSQTKTELTTRFRDFGSRYDPSDDFVKKIMKLGFVDDLIALVKHKEMRELNKTDGKKTARVRVENLEDANLAGTARSNDCTLILTEGLSAKTFAISGLSILKRDLFGVFPLKGKLLNVREATAKQLQTNEEILNIKKILGLQHDKTYTQGTKELRYGKVMILTDADTDGSHIKGLFVNMIHTWWPELLKHDFVTSMRTPIVKVTRGTTNSLSFYNMPDYRTWVERNGGTSGYHVKYYKGLGTSTSQEAKEIFKDFRKNYLQYHYDDEQNKDVLLAFKKTQADDRKVWIKEGTRKNEVLDVRSNAISIGDFIHKDLIWFSIADNVRSIPNVMDGLKPSQRKVLYSCRKRPSNAETKVSQLSGFVSSTTSYHHGEQSLMGTIINMAQDFVGSNNINLLMPVGQFGTRLVGGKDAASPRYIFTKLSDAADRMFHKHDDPLLIYLEDDGTKIEPEYYLPALPLVLINGAEGIGTGYSTHVPCFNPEDVERNVLRMIDGKPPRKMTPWYRGFRGSIEENVLSEGKYTCRGVYERSDATVKITELPVGKWTSDYKEYLEQLVEKGSVKSFTNDSTESTVSFTLKLPTVNNDDKSIDDLLKLTTTIHTTNMHLFDANNTMRKYASPEDILEEFVRVKLGAYRRRKEMLLKAWSEEEIVLGYKVRFITHVMDDVIQVFRKTQQDITTQLHHHKYPAELHDTLLGIRLYAFTQENVRKIEHELRMKREAIERLRATAVPDLWKQDLKQ